MTGPQRSRLHALALQAGVDVPSHLTRDEAEALIDDLAQMTAGGESG